MKTLEYSSAGLALTEQFEGLSLKAYQDVAGVWTIGYGHTGLDVLPGHQIFNAQAGQLLKADLSRATACVNDAVTVPLQQNQFDALVDFTFNVGCGALRGSTLLRQVNAKAFTEAQAEFTKWNHAGGKVVESLVRRRAAEAKLFGANPTARAA